MITMPVAAADMWQVVSFMFASPELRVCMIGGFSALGLVTNLAIIRLLRRRGPDVSAAPFVIIAGLLGVVIPLFLVWGARSEHDFQLPEAIGWMVVLLYIASVATFIHASTSVIYQAVYQWWWNRRDRKYGDACHIEQLPDGSIRHQRSRVSAARELAANRVTSAGAGADVAQVYRKAGLHVPEKPGAACGGNNQVTPAELAYGDLALFTDHYAVVVSEHVIFDNGEPVKFGGPEHLADNFLGFIRPGMDPAVK
ncbi:hypothetical protein D2E71_25100 [Mycobacteroides abscessus]|nr:hypothetical protein D2E71_25100 [Mycobacteroides abscessus]